MRKLLDANKRTSTIVSASLTTPLRLQVEAHCTKHNITPAKALRLALANFFEYQPKPPVPMPRLPSTSTIYRDRIITTSLRTDSHTYASTKKPRPNPHATIRDRLDIYCKAHNIQASMVIRRALFEYTKGDTNPDPIAVVDAWGDR